MTPEQIKSQDYLDNIEEWTKSNKMKLNENKTEVIIFNFSHNFPFATRLHLNNTVLETVREPSILGTIVRSDLSWHSNTRQAGAEQGKAQLPTEIWSYCD